jgi:hypothetical protein
VAFNILKWLRIFLVLIAIHSFCVGLGLILIPLDLYEFFGFQGYAGNFFKIQAGVFHIVMCLAYSWAALDPVRNMSLIRFAIVAKMMATVFLISYAVFVEMIWTVMASGVGDFLMGLILVWFHRRLKPAPA